MKTYYKKRAPIYDRVYQYPERQVDLRYLESYIPAVFENLDILEIACGTGYWTQFIANRAKSILATDATQETLTELSARDLPLNVSSREVDAYRLGVLKEAFDGAFAGLWFSHILKERREEFLTGLHKKLRPGSPVVLLDNTDVQCGRLPIHHTDKFGNTFQMRELENGECYEVLKNFPKQQELYQLTEGIGQNRKFKQLDNFWLFEYDVI